MIPDAGATWVGRAAPDFDLPTAGGESFRLSAHRGETVLVAFWASWCTVCRAEIPALAALQSRRAGLQLVGVNVDRDAEAARRYLRGLDVNFATVLDPDARLMGVYEVETMPTVVVVDPKGIVRLVKVGYSPERGLSEIEQTLARIP